MHLKVGASLVYWFAKPAEVLLLLEAARGSDQHVRAESLHLSPPLDVTRLDDPATGERRIVVRAQGELSIAYEAIVEVAARDTSLAGLAQHAIADLPTEALRYLRPSRYCPSDQMERLVEREFGRLRGGDKVEAILAWVAQHTDYVSGVSDSGTTALGTLVDRAGVCRDFAHLTISLCRAADIPARAVSAYAWKLDPPDMHAVAEVYVGGAWRLVDATGRAPIEGLVRVATGADAADIAFMSIFGRAELVRQAFTVSEAEPVSPAVVDQACCSPLAAARHAAQRPADNRAGVAACFESPPWSPSSASSAVCSAGEAAALSVKEEMKQVVEPASNTLFGVGGDVDPANGPDAAKVPDSRWKDGADAAKALETVAMALTEKGRAKPGAEWAGFVQQMHDISDKAAKAAAAKDGAALAQAANDLSDNCSACHAKFKPQTGD